MNKLVKALAAVTLGSIVVCGAAACSKDKGNVDKEGNTIVKILVHVDENTPEGQAYKKRVDAFNTSYRDKKIKASISFKARSSGAGGYEDTITQKFKKGTLDDIIAFDSPNCAAYANSKILYDSTDLVDAATKADFYESSLNVYENKLYGLPIQESSAGFYYNKRIFNEVGIDVSGYTVENPWTFEQFNSVCQQLKDAGKKPLSMQLDNIKDETATYLLYPFVYASGGSFNDSTGYTAKGYFDSEASKKGYEFLYNLVQKGYTDSTVKDSDFFAGNAGMLLSSGWTIPDIEIKYQANLGNDWGILPYPKGVTVASAMGSWSFGITNNGVKDKSAAKELLLWMTSPESSKIITDATGMIPARKSVATNYEAGSPRDVLMKQLASSGKARPATPAYPTFTASFCNVAYAIADKNTKLADLNSKIATAADSVQAEMDRIKNRH